MFGREECTVRLKHTLTHLRPHLLPPSPMYTLPSLLTHFLSHSCTPSPLESLIYSRNYFLPHSSAPHLFNPSQIYIFIPDSLTP